MNIIGVLRSQPIASRKTYFYQLSGATLFIVDAGNLSFATCFNTTPNNLWVECKVALTPEINQYPLPLKNRFTDDKVQSSILISLPTYK